MLYEDGAVLDGGLFVEPPSKRIEPLEGLGGGDIPRLTSGQAVQELMVFSAGASFGLKKVPLKN